MKAHAVRQFIADKNYKAALLGARTFRIGVTAEQRSIMSRAYEAIVHQRFYQQLGKNINECIDEGVAVLKEVVGC